ncbi:hypothetical protein J437_LFUL003393 [Ladona fulva]|uniref:General transcription factor IIH subunit 3 n=1 Tax=Ladona fulva TaxID=123851 RepID=A0A8K0K3U7_LADFU|nr:hypothetical protein J437_LFUL003393 [Ladona fulva]
MGDEIESSLLVIVIDTNPSQRIVREGSQILTQCLDSVIAFANSHLMMKCSNKLAIIACHNHASKFLYPPSSDDEIGEDGDVRNAQQIDGQYEVFTHVERTVRRNIQRLIAFGDQELPDIHENRITGAVNSLGGDSLLAGALAMALCYIHRIEKDIPPSTKVNSRILVVTASGDSASQYMNYMNVFFTAQKRNIVIDVCSLDQEPGLLQQGCDITGGLYLRIPQIQGLLQYLLWVFLSDPPIRKKLVLPPPVKVDYRAACFCHRELIDIGYVCSVCLSIFCKFSPICTTCHTVFKTPAPLPLKVKKKRIKLS